MKEARKAVERQNSGLGLDACFEGLQEQLTRAIESLDGIKSLKSARKELKKYRLAISAIKRQVKLYEKDARPRTF